MKNLLICFILAFSIAAEAAVKPPIYRLGRFTLIESIGGVMVPSQDGYGYVWPGDNETGDSNPGMDMYIASGSKFGGTGKSGDLIVEPGQSTVGPGGATIIRGGPGLTGGALTLQAGPAQSADVAGDLSGYGGASQTNGAIAGDTQFFGGPDPFAANMAGRARLVGGANLGTAGAQLSVYPLLGTRYGAEYADVIQATGRLLRLSTHVGETIDLGLELDGDSDGPSIHPQARTDGNDGVGFEITGQDADSGAGAGGLLSLRGGLRDGSGTIPANLSLGPATASANGEASIQAENLLLTVTGNTFITDGNLIFNQQGSGIFFKMTGDDTYAGQTGLSGGTQTVPTTVVQGTSVILATCNGTSAGHGSLRVDNIVDGVSFDIISSNPLDDCSKVSWVIFGRTP